MALRLNGSTSGYVELNAPAVAGSQSLIVPDSFGKVLQVKQTLKKTVTAVSNASPTNPQAVSGWSVDITPASTNSKILIYVSSSVSLTNTNGVPTARLYRNGSVISDSLGTNASTAAHSFIGPLMNSTSQGCFISGMYLDSPAATTQQTYQVYMTSNQGGITYYLGNTGGTNSNHVAPLSITAIEVSS